MITQKNQFLYLETKNTSYIMRTLENGMLQHVYYGARVSQDDFSFYNFYRECSFSPVFRMDGLVTSYDAIPQEYATFGRGDFRQPSLIVETADGRRVNELRYKEYAILKGRPGLKGLPFLDTDTEDVETLALTMKDNFSGVEVVLYYSVFAEEDIISRYVLVRNTSGEPVQIRSAASLSVDFERADFDFVSLVYEQRNAYGSTSLNGSRFGSTLCGISLETWLSLGDLKFYKQRRFDCEYISVVGTYFNHFVFFYKFQSISDGLFVQSDLLIVFYVHEVE